MLRSKSRSKLPARPAASEPLPHPGEEYLQVVRQGRRGRYASDEWKRHPRNPRRAVLTMVQNEAVFLPIWLGYYSRFFAPEDIYVLDHESTDGSTEDRGFQRIPVSHDSVDHNWMVRTIEEHQHALLERYDVVLVTDVDEIVAPVPEWGTLGEYIDRFEEEWVNCVGYEIVHLADIEPPYRPDRPILEQRHYWFANGAYDKPVLAAVPMSWRPGFHARADGRVAWDPDLRLIHLHRMDYEICLARHRWRSSRRWNPADLEAGWAAYNRVTEEAEFRRWFYGSSGFEEAGIEMALEPIPASWRGLF